MKKNKINYICRVLSFFVFPFIAMDVQAAGAPCREYLGNYFMDEQTGLACYADIPSVPHGSIATLSNSNSYPNWKNMVSGSFRCNNGKLEKVSLSCQAKAGQVDPTCGPITKKELSQENKLCEYTLPAGRLGQEVSLKQLSDVNSRQGRGRQQHEGTALFRCEHTRQRNVAGEIANFGEWKIIHSSCVPVSTSIEGVQEEEPQDTEESTDGLMGPNGKPVSPLSCQPKGYVEVAAENYPGEKCKITIEGKYDAAMFGPGAPQKGYFKAYGQMESSLGRAFDGTEYEGGYKVGHAVASCRQKQWVVVAGVCSLFKSNEEPKINKPTTCAVTSWPAIAASNAPDRACTFTVGSTARGAKGFGTIGEKVTVYDNYQTRSEISRIEKETGKRLIGRGDFVCGEDGLWRLEASTCFVVSRVTNP